tara:strand:- start:512 stop:967 length:456 start_codon:yes stop_codon:yes gene_type:complete
MLKIYRIVDNTNGNIYIGKTKQKYLSSRLASHRDKRSCCSSSQIINNGDYKIELIEETEDESRERYWVLNTDCINKVIPGRTKKEWYQLNREKNKDRLNSLSNLYYKNNKEKVLKKDKIKNNWYNSMGGSPRYNNLSLLKIDPNLFFYSNF